ncbi:ABC transporter permease [Mycetocola miduiensis]|uniref:ABC-type nitrate/sulfonate/bicarbonate transport system, permease component n=1 Tax=Mycetocola miduiensis TaxID=995034 RepID=A0A1I5ADU3_9MICO|nr:ABC transporter permease [Mycetocola miduiensis]SFN60379.1 ABC-type nitrate/sulfonate/bicarbonate transport system, permease component [Mycetocola miduiensis]
MALTASISTANRPRASREPQSARRQWWSRFALRWIVLAVLLALWQLATMAFPSPFFPQPIRIFERAALLWLPGPNGVLTPSMLNDVLPSMGRVLLGFAISVVLAISLGVAIGLSRKFADYVDPIIQFLRAVPPPALIPIFLVLFGTGDEMRVLLIAFGTAWPILLNTIDGVRSIEELKYETATVFRISFVSRLKRIVLPGAAPKILAGVRTSLSLGLILMVISEMVAASSGIGFSIVQAQRGFGFPDMWAGIVLLGIIGFLLNTLLTVIERRILAWQRSSGRETA